MKNGFQIENFRKADALEYAALGWHVFPVHHPTFGPDGTAVCSCRDAKCRNVGKHPRTANGLKDATTDRGIIAGWWQTWASANLGIACGAQSGIIVLDVDQRHGGPEALDKLESEFGSLPETVRAVTGGGGAHYVFEHPERIIRNSANRVGTGIDVRGDGGYIVAAPSLHASGERYTWAAGLSPTDLSPAPVPAWLLARMTEPEKPHEPPKFPRRVIDHEDTAGHWLGRALMRAGDGNRNDTGLWLAAQLRDSGISRDEAESVMREYAERVPQNGDRYTPAEALATVRSAYSRPAREPAKSTTYSQKVIRDTAAVKPAAVVAGASAELRAHLEDVISRKVYNVAWPWHEMTRLTQALLPGTISVVCGDPGVGKTFFVLQCLRDWISNGHEAAVFFIEKDRKFHTRRLLAQLEGDGRFVDFDWVRDNPAAVRSAIDKHSATIDQLGKAIHSAPGDRVTLDSILGWIRQQASAGRRVLVIDPITAALAGVERWTKDDDFVLAAQAVMTAHGSSLVLVTHAKKGNRVGASSGHDMAAGAAYYRFADTTIWIQKAKRPKRVRYLTPHGYQTDRFGLFFQLHKTRDGRGSGTEVAVRFGEGLTFSEQGLVVGEVQDEEGEAA